MNIAHQLIKNYNFVKLSEDFNGKRIYSQTLHKKLTKLIFVKQEIIDTQFLEDVLKSKMFIFLSRHSSAKRIPTLSVHTPGNLSKANYGGKSQMVSICPAGAMKKALEKMSERVNKIGLDYAVSYECTHHGPSFDVPTMFVELGSSPKEWKDKRAAKIVADAAVAAISNSSQYSVVLGVGGPHYNAKFTKLALSTQKAFGHIIPKYALAEVDTEMIKQCVERTFEPIDSAILDWKGIKSSHKPKIVAALGAIGISYEKV